MKKSTSEVCEYLCSRDAREYFEQRLVYYSQTAAPGEPITDRFPGYALYDAIETVAEFEDPDDPGYFSEDCLDWFSYERKDETLGSHITRIMRTVKSASTMERHFGKLLKKHLVQVDNDDEVYEA